MRLICFFTLISNRVIGCLWIYTAEIEYTFFYQIQCYGHLDDICGSFFYHSHNFAYSLD